MHTVLFFTSKLVLMFKILLFFSLQFGTNFPDFDISGKTMPTGEEPSLSTSESFPHIQIPFFLKAGTLNNAKMSYNYLYSSRRKLVRKLNKIFSHKPSRGTLQVFQERRERVSTQGMEGCEEWTHLWMWTSCF